MYTLNFTDLPDSNFIVFWNEFGSFTTKFIGYCTKKYAFKFCNCLLRSGCCFDIKVFDKHLILIKEF